MTWRLGRVLGWGLGAACAWGLAPCSQSQAQSFGPPVVSQAQRPAALATMGAGYANPYANPYTNPMMNPFLNPYMTQMPTNQSSTLLYYMAAQQQRGGIGSSTGLGGSQERPMSAAGGAAQGMASGSGSGSGSATGTGAGAISGSRSSGSQQPAGASRMPAGRVSPSRPAANYHVSGRFDDNPSFNDRRSRLAKQYPAYGSRASNVETGAPVTAGSTPAPNVNAARTFNRYPSYNTNNDR